MIWNSKNSVGLKFQICFCFKKLDVDDEVDIRRAWESTRKNVKVSDTNSLGYCELKQQKPWFDEEC